MIDVRPKEYVNGNMIMEERSKSAGATRKGLAAKFFALFCLLAAATVTAATATDFKALAEEGYRWVRVNGPYATPNKNDAAKLAGAKSASSDIELQDKTHAYFLLPGMLVFVLENDSAAGLSRVRASGIVVDLWTETKYLSTQPVKDSYGVTETPDSSGLGHLGSPTPSPSPSAGAGTLLDNQLLNPSPSPTAH
ncbi:MAG: hypothetical protein JOZ08_11120 [Verrucomicrobia bacterium]|nr:hypothetical protein [Verrucomicrobiota bacterium]MBV8274666.1 hypothetical protein [Verrucomicrobiota bacterium]